MTAGSLREHLDALDECYRDMLAVNADFTALCSDPARLDAAAAQYATEGFVQLPGVVAGDALDRMARELWPVLHRVAFDVRVPHERVDGADPTGGGRLRRVDAGSLDATGQGAVLADILSALGIAEFGRLLAERMAPVLDRIIPGAGYKRIFFNLYEEDDYLTAHDDAHMAERIDVSFPVTMDASSGLRVLHGAYYETHYDGDGAMSVLGPRVWHEVPALLRVSDFPAPRRLTMTMRYG